MNVRPESCALRKSLVWMTKSQEIVDNLMVWTHAHRGRKTGDRLQRKQTKRVTFNELSSFCTAWESNLALNVFQTLTFVTEHKEKYWTLA